MLSPVRFSRVDHEKEVLKMSVPVWSHYRELSVYYRPVYIEIKLLYCEIDEKIKSL
jgi:hypothetical protein